MSYPTDTILVRNVPQGDSLDELKVVGSETSRMTVTSNKEFGGVFELTAERASIDYTPKFPEGGNLPAPTHAPIEKSPEEVFAAEQRVHPPKEEKGRKAIRKAKEVAEAEVATGKPEPAPTKEEVAKTA